jgi:hypothetical protein
VKYPIRYPDGREFGPYSIEELRKLAAEKAYPPNTEILANGEWVSLGGWLVVRKRVEQLEADEASRPRAAPPPVAPAVDLPGPPEKTLNQKAIFIGAGLFVVVILAALLLR